MVDKEVPAKAPCPKCKWTPGPKDSLVRQTGLKDGQYKIILTNPDNFEECYLKSLDAINNTRDQYPDVDIRVDYTGGTKTMSVGLAIAAENSGCSFSIVRGTRLDLEKVYDGTERVTTLRTERVTINRQINLAKEMSADWDYVGAVKVLEHVGERVPYEDEEQIQYLLVAARGLTAWDRFHYAEAARLLAAYRNKALIKKCYQYSKQIVVILDWYHGEEHGLKGINVSLPVYDCLRNAQRCAHQNRFDDAVARLYRTLEMYAQLCLRLHGLKTSGINTDLIPEQIRGKYKEKEAKYGKLNLGLHDSYGLLFELGHPAGKVYQDMKHKLLNLLSARNQSFMAHGFTPINKDVYHKLQGLMEMLITESDRKLGIKDGLNAYHQLPCLADLAD